MLFAGISCEKDYLTDCEVCYKEKPLDVFLHVYVSYSENDPVNHTVTVYEGKMEDNIIISTITSADSEFFFNAFLYKDYTIVVEYTVNGNNYKAIDEVCPQLRYDDTTCDYPCYYVFGNTADISLRYL